MSTSDVDERTSLLMADDAIQPATEGQVTDTDDRPLSQGLGSTPAREASEHFNH